jgi:hypothetical protein
MTEREVIAKFRESLERRFGSRATAYKAHQDMYTEAGFPDLVVCVEGEIYLVEAKRNTKQVKLPSQVGYHNKLKKCGIDVIMLYDTGYVAPNADGVLEYVEGDLADALPLPRNRAVFRP